LKTTFNYSSVGYTVGVLNHFHRRISYKVNSWLPKVERTNSLLVNQLSSWWTSPHGSCNYDCRNLLWI